MSLFTTILLFLCSAVVLFSRFGGPGLVHSKGKLGGCSHLKWLGGGIHIHSDLLFFASSTSLRSTYRSLYKVCLWFTSISEKREKGWKEEIGERLYERRVMWI